MAKNNLQKVVQWFNVFFIFNSYTALGNNNNWCVGIGTGCVAEGYFSSQYVISYDNENSHKKPVRFCRFC